MIKKIYYETMIIVGLGTFLIWGSVQFVYIPRLRDISATEKELERNKEEIINVKTLAKTPDFFTDHIGKIEAYHTTVKSLLPKKVKVTSILKEISTLANNNNVTIISMKPFEVSNGSDEDAGGYKKVGIRVVLECGYRHLTLFIKSVENSTLTLMTIKELSLSTGENNSPQTLVVNLTVEANYQDE